MTDPATAPAATAEAPPILAIEGVCNAYGRTRVLHDVDLTVRAGECVAIIGRSGSGKSTLLRAIDGLEPISAGRIAFEGRPLRAGTRETRRARARIGYVFQNFNLFPHLTALGNVALALRVVHGRSRTDGRERAREALVQVGLGEKLHARPDELSGGQQQRVAIARALAIDPALMLFDEPTSALDPELVGEVLAVIRALAKTGRTMVLATHEMRFAQGVADRIVFMDAGRVVAAGPPARMFGADAPPDVREFLRHVLSPELDEVPEAAPQEEDVR